MSEEFKTDPAEPLEVLAQKIEAHSTKSDNHVIAAAMLVRDVRRRIDAGEAGDITWHEWGPKNINLSPSRLYELQCIADADDPAAEIERIRCLIRERVKKHREKRAAEMRSLEQERRDLIAWARKASIEEIRRVLRQVAGRADTALPGPIKVRPTVERQSAA